jgi:alkaline phosphatase D
MPPPTTNLSRAAHTVLIRLHQHEPHMTTPRSFNRRDFIIGLGAGAAALPGIVRAQTAPSGVFAHGVASGDPEANAVVIWTRVSPSLGNSVAVNYDVALDANFTQLVRRGRALALATNDHTVKVDVRSLPAGAQLFYRFSAGGQTSPVGKTRTLPTGALNEVKLAVFSCSNYPAGYFHAYAEAARMSDVFAAVHVGDYIYEYERGGYASDAAASMGREVLPSTELLALADYRQRYAQYRTDADLQALHAAMPWICVWDDHEIANDTWKAGADNHSPATEGDFFARRNAAIKAYHEWLPIRPPETNRLERIYRSFTFGNLVDLHMLDTRVIGRDKQLAYADYSSASGFNSAAFGAAMANPARQLLGTEQSTWLGGRFASTSATWSILGQQVLMGRMNIPAPLVLGQISFSNYNALVYKAQTAPSSLTPQDIAILSQAPIPYNLDAWDGYAVARETVLGMARRYNKNLVVLSGDTHNAWASDLTDYQGNQVGVEFATPGVTSPGFEAYFPSENPLVVAAGLEQIIAPLVYAETASRGFMVVTATPAECRCEWVYVSDVKQVGYSAYVGKRLRTLPGAGQRRLIPA